MTRPQRAQGGFAARPALTPRAAGAEQRHELGDGEHAVGGHDLAQPPLVADLAFHRLLRPGCPMAAARVSSSARRTVRVLKSDDTHVYSDVVLACSCPHWNWTNSGSRPAS